MKHIGSGSISPDTEREGRNADVPPFFCVVLSVHPLRRSERANRQTDPQNRRSKARNASAEELFSPTVFRAPRGLKSRENGKSAVLSSLAYVRERTQGTDRSPRPEPTGGGERDNPLSRKGDKTKSPLSGWVIVCSQTITLKKFSIYRHFLGFGVIVGRQFTPFFYF